MRDDRELELQELLEEVRRIDVLSKRLVNDVLAGGYTSVFRGAGLEFETVREYVEGDDPRKVDWNVTARMGRPFVKEYVEEREQTVLFVLDLSASMDGGFSHWSPRQMAARICACLALSAVRNDDKVGLVAFSEGVDRYVRPDKGVAHALRIVRDCLALHPGGERTHIAPALELVSRVVSRHAIVFVVSDFLTDGWEHALSLCARRHDVVAVRVRPPELEPVAAGLVRVRQPESGDETVVDWGSRRVRDTYAERVAAWRTRTEEALGRAQVDLMDVPVPRERDVDAVARPILRFFRMREERGAKR
jgi:uncharacterized protein (DUF58 family)